FIGRSGLRIEQVEPSLNHRSDELFSSAHGALGPYDRSRYAHASLAHGDRELLRRGVPAYVESRTGDTNCEGPRNQLPGTVRGVNDVRTKQSTFEGDARSVFVDVDDTRPRRRLDMQNGTVGERQDERASGRRGQPGLGDPGCTIDVEL